MKNDVKATVSSSGDGAVTNLRQLNLGCGTDIRSGWVNADIVDYGGNVVMDLNKYPYPFPESNFDYVLCSHVLEHLGNFNQAVTVRLAHIGETRTEFIFILADQWIIPLQIDVIFHDH